MVGSLEAMTEIVKRGRDGVERDKGIKESTLLRRVLLPGGRPSAFTLCSQCSRSSDSLIWEEGATCTRLHHPEVFHSFGFLSFWDFFPLYLSTRSQNSPSSLCRSLRIYRQLVSYHSFYSSLRLNPLRRRFKKTRTSSKSRSKSQLGTQLGPRLLQRNVSPLPM